MIDIDLVIFNLSGVLVEGYQQKALKQSDQYEMSRNASMTEKIELHKYLKSLGIKIVCVTDSMEDMARQILTTTGQMPYIDRIVSNEMLKRDESYSECYSLAMKEMNANPKKCICVENYVVGLQSAKSSLAEYIWRVDNSTKVNIEAYVAFVNGLHQYKECCRV